MDSHQIWSNGNANRRWERIETPSSVRKEAFTRVQGTGGRSRFTRAEVMRVL